MQYAVLACKLEAMSQAYMTLYMACNNGKLDSLYINTKRLKILRNCPEYYHYVAKSSCCAKSLQKSDYPHWVDKIGKFLFFSNKLFRIAYKSQIGLWKKLKRLNDHNVCFQVHYVPFEGLYDNYHIITMMIITKFWGLE